MDSGHDCICVGEAKLITTLEMRRQQFQMYILQGQAKQYQVLCAVEESMLSLCHTDSDDEIMIIELRPSKNHKMAVILCRRVPDEDLSNQ